MQKGNPLRLIMIGSGLYSDYYVDMTALLFPEGVDLTALSGELKEQTGCDLTNGVTGSRREAKKQFIQMLLVVYQRGGGYAVLWERKEQS